MEVVAVQPNPDVKLTVEEMVAYGGGVVVGVAGLEWASGELEARQVPKGGIAVFQYLVSAGAFIGARKSDGMMRRILIGVGAGAFAEGVSSTVEAVRGG